MAKTAVKSSRKRKAATTAKPRLAALEKDNVRLRTQLKAAKAKIAALQLRADTDALVDLPNRRGFMRELIRSIAYVKRYGAQAALVYLDVDGFKPLNDRFGHGAGDAYLKSLAEALVANVRRSDMVARLGGDEFAIILWNLTLSDAEARVRAIEDFVDLMTITRKGVNIGTGVSAGVVMLDGGDVPERALERADAQMYQRKLERRRQQAEAVRISRQRRGSRVAASEARKS